MEFSLFSFYFSICFLYIWLTRAAIEKDQKILHYVSEFI